MDHVFNFLEHLSKEALFILIVALMSLCGLFVKLAYGFFVKHFRKIECNFAFIFADIEATDLTMDKFFPANGKPGYLEVKQEKRNQLIERNNQIKGK